MFQEQLTNKSLVSRIKNGEAIFIHGKLAKEASYEKNASETY